MRRYILTNFKKGSYYKMVMFYNNSVSLKYMVRIINVYTNKGELYDFIPWK